MYSSTEFGELAEWLRSFMDRTVKGLDEDQLSKVQDIFLDSSRYEYLFWDAAYRMEDWSI